MHISGYANMVLKHVSFDELVRLYGDWIVGVGEFTRSRSSRLKNGVPKDLEARSLTQRFELVDEEKRSQLRTRSMPDRWICHWIHGDAGKPDRSWNNVIEIARTGKDLVQLTHVAGWWSSNPDARYYEAAPPNTLKFLLERYAGNIVSPREITRNEPMPLAYGESEHFVKHILLDPKREQPILIITPNNRSGTYPVNPYLVQDRVAGACMTVVVEDPETSWELSKALAKAGFDPRVGVSNGAARLFFKDLKKEVSPYECPLVFIDPRKRVEQSSHFLAAFAISQYGKRLDQNKWVDIIARFDRQEFRERIHTLLSVGPMPITVDPAIQEELEAKLVAKDKLADELKAQIADVREAYERQLVDLARQYEERESKLLDDLKEAQSFIDMQDEEIKRLEGREQTQLIEMSALEQKLLQKAQERDQTEWDELEPIDVLLEVEKMFPNVSVHERAKKACAASPFRDPRTLLLSLLILGINGGHATLDEQLKRHLGTRARYKPKDSDATKKTFSEQRQYVSMITGKAGVLDQHITMGGSTKAERHFQIYFDAFPDGKVEVIHAGEHKSTVSHDT